MANIKDSYFKKAILCLLALVMNVSGIFMLSGCNNKSNSVNITDFWEYNVKFQGEIIEWQPQFADNVEPLYYTYLSFHNGEQVLDENMPKDRVLIFNTEKEYSAIFTNKVNVNFSTDTLVISTFTTSYPVSNWRLKKLYKSDEQLNVTFVRYRQKGVDDATRPIQKWIAVKMSKQNASSTKLTIETRTV
ncbi:MAG: hypothetical protein IJ033_00520 [Clostridia bacterium]|nr:hypothetical protein [Clostridia bacterium]